MPNLTEIINKITDECRKLIQLAAGFQNLVKQSNINAVSAQNAENELQYLATFIANLPPMISALDALDINSVELPAQQQTIENTLKAMLQMENDARVSFQIGARFNVIRTQLQSLAQKMRQEILSIQETRQQQIDTPVMAPKNMMTIYVYLFNAQGAVTKNWQKLLLPEALNDHSINRPIYGLKEQVEAVIRNKPDKAKHAYLEITIDKSNLIQAPMEKMIKDINGCPLMRLKQGALKPENIINFVHNGVTYKVLDKGAIAPVNPTPSPV